jgi:hypothetical protein
MLYNAYLIEDEPQFNTNIFIIWTPSRPPPKWGGVITFPGVIGVFFEVILFLELSTPLTLGRGRGRVFYFASIA